ncbi:MAG: class I SAM-dependent methyltransferase [Actinobacteria bacterium]|nr:class I SAM-dependent methyltransferase [Actinomycetota bacterium]
MRSFGQIAFRAVCYREPERIEEFRKRHIAETDASAEEFMRRLGGYPDVTGKRVLDVGCGFGALAIRLARDGAAAVHGVDIGRISIEAANRRLAGEAPDVADRVSFQIIERLSDVEERNYDIAVLKDSFEHIDDPEGFVREIGEGDYLAPHGLLTIGFGPLWKSPFGGHLERMTRFPWAHLIFPERAIMLERRRFSLGPWDGAMHFTEVEGGLNRMTYGRFIRALKDGGFVSEHFAVNVKHGSRAAEIMRRARRVAPLREYFTFNVYTTWRRASEERPEHG